MFGILYLRFAKVDGGLVLVGVLGVYILSGCARCALKFSQRLHFFGSVRFGISIFYAGGTLGLGVACSFPKSTDS